MDANARNLLDELKAEGDWCCVVFTPESQAVIYAALELAAAVEGPRMATPETDAAKFVGDPQGREAELEIVPAYFAASLECRMLAALRALKAERERYAKLRDVDPDGELPTVFVHKQDSWGNWRYYHLGGSELDAALAAQEGRHD